MKFKKCREGEPVYLTKNGRGRFVGMAIEDYELERAEKKLLIICFTPQDAEYLMEESYAI